MESPLKNIILRGNDPTGHGYYGAKRGNRKHKGLDLVALPGEKVKSMIDGIVTKIGYPYKGNSLFKFIEVTNDIYRIRIMYVSPNNVDLNQKVFKGQFIGLVQDISSFWNPRMKNHIHVEIRKYGLLTDPEPLLVR